MKWQNTYVPYVDLSTTKQKAFPMQALHREQHGRNCLRTGVCPLCGATKAEFEKQGEQAISTKKKPTPVIESG